MYTVLNPETVVLALAFGKLFLYLGGICLVGFVLTVWQRHREIKRMQALRKMNKDLWDRTNEAIRKGTKIV